MLCFIWLPQFSCSLGQRVVSKRGNPRRHATGEEEGSLGDWAEIAHCAFSGCFRGIFVCPEPQQESSQEPPYPGGPEAWGEDATAKGSLLPNPGSCSGCTVKPNRLEGQRLGQRKVYCRAMQGEQVAYAQNSPRGLQQSILKGRVRGVGLGCVISFCTVL